MLIAHVRGLITLLRTTHEPPSMCRRESQKFQVHYGSRARGSNSDRRLCKKTEAIT